MVQLDTVNDFCIILVIMVQLDTVNDFMLFMSHCYLYYTLYFEISSIDIHNTFDTDTENDILLSIVIVTNITCFI